MNAMLEVCDEEALGFDFEDGGNESLSDRRGLANMRQLSGRERAAQHSRHARRSAPSLNSGAHRRRNKRYGV